MDPDDTSSQHGAHEFTFALIPYAGTWHAAGVAAQAQEINSPLHTVSRDGKVEILPASHLRLDAENVVLSAVKTADDGSGDLIVRVYETAGHATETVLNGTKSGRRLSFRFARAKTRTVFRCE